MHRIVVGLFLILEGKRKIVTLSFKEDSGMRAYRKQLLVCLLFAKHFRVFPLPLFHRKQTYR